MFDLEDSEDEMIERLTLITRQLAALSGVDGGDVSNVDVETSPTLNNSRDFDVSNETTVNRTINLTEPSEENTGDTFSSGPEPIVLTDTENWEHFRLGKIADVINIRATDSVDIAYSRPTNEGNIIRLGASDLPFTDGGNQGVGTSHIWIRKSPLASSNPEVRIIAR